MRKKLSPEQEIKESLYLKADNCLDLANRNINNFPSQGLDDPDPESIYVSVDSLAKLPAECFFQEFGLLGTTYMTVDYNDMLGIDSRGERQSFSLRQGTFLGKRNPFNNKRGRKRQASIALLTRLYSEELLEEEQKLCLNNHVAENIRPENRRLINAALLFTTTSQYYLLGPNNPEIIKVSTFPAICPDYPDAIAATRQEIYSNKYALNLRPMTPSDYEYIGGMLTNMTGLLLVGKNYLVD